MVLGQTALGARPLGASVAGVAGLTQSVNDTLSLADSINFDRLITPADVIALADAVNEARGLSISESISLADSVLEASGFNRNIDDTLAISDSVLAQLILLVTINDTLALVDALVLDRGIITQDVLSITDNINAGLIRNLVLLLSEILIISDEILLSFGNRNPHRHGYKTPSQEGPFMQIT